jgi:hypothetical protein
VRNWPNAPVDCVLDVPRGAVLYHYSCTYHYLGLCRYLGVLRLSSRVALLPPTIAWGFTIIVRVTIIGQGYHYWPALHYWDCSTIRGHVRRMKVPCVSGVGLSGMAKNRAT